MEYVMVLTDICTTLSLVHDESDEDVISGSMKTRRRRQPTKEGSKCNYNIVF